MSLEEKKQSFGGSGGIKREIPSPQKEGEQNFRGGGVRGGGIRKEIPLPPKKEEEDTSLFGKGANVSQEKGRMWTKRRDISKTMGIPPSKMSETWGKLTKGTGYFFERKEAEKQYKEIKNLPTKSREKYGIKSEGERLKMLKLLKKSLDK